MHVWLTLDAHTTANDPADARALTAFHLWERGLSIVADAATVIGNDERRRRCATCVMVAEAEMADTAIASDALRCMMRETARRPRHEWWARLAARLWPEDERRPLCSEHGKDVVTAKEQASAQDAGAKLTYGELAPEGVRRLLGPELLHADGGVLVDLGAGLGKLAIQARRPRFSAADARSDWVSYCRLLLRGGLGRWWASSWPSRARTLPLQRRPVLPACCAPPLI